MRRVAILQARVNSSRLPGKVLLDVAGRPMLARQIERLRQCVELDEIVVATSDDPSDDPLPRLADECDVRWYRGSQEDVLGRFTQAAREARADIVVRFTGDCPVIDPETSDRVVRELVERHETHDYSSNVIERTYPRGLDTEALFSDVLEQMHRRASSRAAREHVTVYLRSERRDLFDAWHVVDREDNSDLRWTVDTLDDLRLVRHVYEALRLAEERVSYRTLLAYVRSRPEWSTINATSTTWSPP